MRAPDRVETVKTHGTEQTEAFAARWVADLPAEGVTVGLVGGLGAGKTCFVRGLARGLEVDPREVASPTFVYLVDYEGRRRLFHADLYRFEDLSDAARGPAIESLGLIEAVESTAITAIEWWQYYQGPTPERLVLVEFSIENVDDRALSLSYWSV